MRDINDLPPHIIVWCASAHGLISTYSKYGLICTFLHYRIPDSAIIVQSESELFDILRKRDGTKVAFPASLLNDYLGWTDATILTL